MTTPLEPNTTARIATTDRGGPAASPRIKLHRRRIAIDHPDPQAGERLLADALGAVDRDALHGILSQLVKASAMGQRPDQGNLAFMISMMKSIAPRDSIEAMLAAQMVSIHVATMRCACRLACTDDIPQQESITRALTRLARTFAAQIEALSRHRNNGERAITVRNVSVQDGGNAIVGNVTQHANVIISEANAATAAELAPFRQADEHEHDDTRQGAAA